MQCGGGKPFWSRQVTLHWRQLQPAELSIRGSACWKSSSKGEGCHSFSLGLCLGASFIWKRMCELLFNPFQSSCQCAELLWTLPRWWRWCDLGRDSEDSKACSCLSPEMNHGTPVQFVASHGPQNKPYHSLPCLSGQLYSSKATTTTTQQGTPAVIWVPVDHAYSCSFIYLFI